MKLKLIISCTVAAALGVGFFSGRYVARREWNNFFDWYICTDASNQAHLYVRALSQLREGQQSNALELLEGSLDGELITYCDYEQLRPEDRNETGLRAIQVVRDYRAKHPWRNASGDINAAVERLFALGK